MLIIVDRFEGDYAVLLEENQTREVPRQALAADIREGDAVFPDLEKGCSSNGKKKISDSKKDGRIMGIKQHNFGCSKLYAKQTLCAKEISSRTRFLYKNLHNFLPVRTNVFQYG